MERLGDLDAETVEDALDVVQDLVLWELTPQRWGRVQEILANIAAALTARDAVALREAVAELELSGPVRALRIGSKEVIGVPEPVVGQQYPLEHALVVERSRQAAAGRTPGGIRGDQPTP